MLEKRFEILKTNNSYKKKVTETSLVCSIRIEPSSHNHRIQFQGNIFPNLHQLLMNLHGFHYLVLSGFFFDG